MGRSHLGTSAIEDLLRYRVGLALHLNLPLSILRHLYLKNLKPGAAQVQRQELALLCRENKNTQNTLKIITHIVIVTVFSKHFDSK